MANEYIWPPERGSKVPIQQLHRAEQRIDATHIQTPRTTKCLAGLRRSALGAKYSRANGIANDYGKPEAETEYA